MLAVLKSIRCGSFKPDWPLTEESNFRKVINFIAFQAAWFAAVLGAAHSMPWLGVVAAPAALALHLMLSPDWKPELLLAIAAAGTGFVFDSILIDLGMFSPVAYVFPTPFSSLWMVMLWVNLATTLNVFYGLASGALCARRGLQGNRRTIGLLQRRHTRGHDAAA